MYTIVHRIAQFCEALTLNNIASSIPRRCARVPLRDSPLRASIEAIIGYDAVGHYALMRDYEHVMASRDTKLD